MSEVSLQTLSPQSVVSAALRQLNQEQIEDAVACFTTDCGYKDHGIGLEFTDKERLTEFFRKTRELYPDYFLQADQTFVSSEHVITQDTASHYHRAFLRWTHQEDPYFDSWSLDRTY